MPVTTNPPGTTIPELLTVDQTAALLGVSRRTVWELRADGVLLPVRVRTCTRWRHRDVLRYIESLEGAADAR